MNRRQCLTNLAAAPVVALPELLEGAAYRHEHRVEWSGAPKMTPAEALAVEQALEKALLSARDAADALEEASFLHDLAEPDQCCQCVQCNHAKATAHAFAWMLQVIESEIGDMRRLKAKDAWLEQRSEDRHRRLVAAAKLPRRGE